MEGKSEYPSYRWVILASLCLAIMAAYTDMIAIAPIIGDVAASLRVDVGTATNLMMGFVLSAACVLICGGVIVDKFGLPSRSLLGLFCATIPASLMPWIGQSYEVVMVARLVQGASIGFSLATIGPVVVLWFPRDGRGLAGGIIIAFISVGSALGGIDFTDNSRERSFLAGHSFRHVSFRMVFHRVDTVVARRSPSPPGKGELSRRAAGRRAGTFSKAVRLPMTWIGVLVVFFNTWNLYCFLNLVPAYAAVPRPMGIGLGSVTAGRLVLVGAGIGIISTILGGWVFDRFARTKWRPAVLVGFLLTALFAFPLTLTDAWGGLPLFIACLMLVGWGVNFMGASFNGFIAANYSPHIVGRMVGWWFGFGAFGGALGIYVGGRTVQATGSFKTAISLVSISAVIGFALDCFLKPANMDRKRQPVRLRPRLS